MSLVPVGDQLKVKLDSANPHGFAGGERKGSESGVVVAMPDPLSFNYFGFHSFAFENSLGSEKLTKLYEYYQTFVGKRVFWEELQDRGRVVKEGDEEFVFLKMTDIIAYSDDVNIDAQSVSGVGSRGSFAV
jgi:hypothetical protein